MALPKLVLRLPLYTVLVLIRRGERKADHRIRESEVTMKKKLLTSITGIAMSAAMIVSGCAGTANSASSASNKNSVVQEAGAENASGQSADQTAGQSADQSADQTAGQSADQSADQAGGQSADQTAGQSADQSADQSTAELKTVEPSAYAGQTVYGKVTAVNGSDVTVTLGTMKKKSKKSTTESDSAKDTVAEDAAAVEDKSTAEDTSAADKTSENGNAASDSQGSSDSGTETTGKSDKEKSQGSGKKKKSPFTSSGEQMTVTIPDGLTETEIKEGKILKLTLDDSGTVTSVEVKSKSKSSSGSGSNKNTTSI